MNHKQIYFGFWISYEHRRFSSLVDITPNEYPLKIHIQKFIGPNTN